MNSENINMEFLLNLTKFQSILVKRFDRGLGNGIGFNEFLILFFLNQSDNKKMRRIDLAEKINITAFGITRMLLPMGKIGLVKSGPAKDDARVRFVLLSKNG